VVLKQSGEVGVERHDWNADLPAFQDFRVYLADDAYGFSVH
jgi:hypothetical protein